MVISNFDIIPETSVLEAIRELLKDQEFSQLTKKVPVSGPSANNKNDSLLCWQVLGAKLQRNGKQWVHDDLW